MEESKTFNIPIQDKEQCEKFNAEFETDFKSTEEHIDGIVESLYKMIETVGADGGWYRGDSLKIEVRVKYCPEDK